MAKLKIVKEGDEILRKRSREVTEITPKILTLLDDMAETMRLADGCGLAAVQVGVLRRICIVDAGDGLVELINPKIVGQSGRQEECEGCLSCPNNWGITSRPMSVIVEAYDRHGNKFRVKGEGLKARAFCHEIDHLDGILFTTKVIRPYVEE